MVADKNAHFITVFLPLSNTENVTPNSLISDKKILLFNKS